MFSIFGIYVGVKVAAWNIHQSQEEIITQIKNESDIIKLSLTKKQETNFKWERENKEFWYNDEMYDLIRTEKYGAYTIYYCLKDQKETNLFNEFFKIIKEQTDDKRSPVANAAKLLLKIFSGALLDHLRYDFSIHALVNKFYKDFQLNYSFMFQRIDIPPPKSL